MQVPKEHFFIPTLMDFYLSIRTLSPVKKRSRRTISATPSTLPTRPSRFVLRWLYSSPAIVFDAIVSGPHWRPCEKRSLPRPRAPVCVGRLTTFRRHRRERDAAAFLSISTHARVLLGESGNGEEASTRRRKRNRNRVGAMWSFPRCTTELNSTRCKAL